MKPESISLIRQCLPETVDLPYYADRESAWILAQLMLADTPVAVLKRDPQTAPLVKRPLIRAHVAGCGGVLRQRDVMALAHADQSVNWSRISAPARVALDELCCTHWQGFRLNFGAFGVGRERMWSQMSRNGGNLVVQLGFPCDHAALMGRYLGRNPRKELEFNKHPVRETGAPTLAWARLDVDLETGQALIEEVQSDWLRFAQARLLRLEQHAPRSRAYKSMKAYEGSVRQQYQKIWPRAILLAALWVLRDHLGRCDVFMHRPETGTELKLIWGNPAAAVTLYRSAEAVWFYRNQRGTHLPTC